MENKDQLFCDKCGKELVPAPARFDGEYTTVGYLPHDCKPENNQPLGKEGKQEGETNCWRKKHGGDECKTLCNGCFHAYKFASKQPEESYPGQNYQRLFNAIDDIKGSPLKGEMDEVISIVQEDFSTDKLFTLAEALAMLRSSLRADKDYYYGWQANIAMAFMDEYGKEFGESPKMRVFVLEVANAAAKRFLDQLINQ